MLGQTFPFLPKRHRYSSVSNMPHHKFKVNSLAKLFSFLMIKIQGERIMLHCNVGKTLGLKEPLQMIQGATVILIVLVKNWIFICFLFTAPFTPPPHSPHHSPQKSGCTCAPGDTGQICANHQMLSFESPSAATNLFYFSQTCSCLVGICCSYLKVLNYVNRLVCYYTKTRTIKSIGVGKWCYNFYKVIELNL